MSARAKQPPPDGARHYRVPVAMVRMPDPPPPNGGLWLLVLTDDGQLWSWATGQREWLLAHDIPSVPGTRADAAATP